MLEKYDKVGLHLSLLHFLVDHLLREPGGVTDHKVPLIPGRVVPQIFLQERVDVGQLLIPLTKLPQHPLSVIKRSNTGQTGMKSLYPDNAALPPATCSKLFVSILIFFGVLLP